MSSLLAELERRENAARERVAQLREQITELTHRLEAEEDLVSPLAITRETVEEILGEAVELVERPPGLPLVAWRPNQERFGRGRNHEAAL